MLQYTIFSFSKQLENIRGYDLTDSHAMKNHLKILTEKVIELRQSKKEQQNTPTRVHNTLNNADNFLEQLCSWNLKQKLYTASINTFKRKKHDVDLKSEENNKDYVCVKPGIWRSQQLEEFLKSRVVSNLFAKPKDRIAPIGNIFEAR